MDFLNFYLRYLVFSTCKLSITKVFSFFSIIFSIPSISQQYFLSISLSLSLPSLISRITKSFKWNTSAICLRLIYIYIYYKPKTRCVGINIKYKNTSLFFTNISVVLHNPLVCRRSRLCKRLCRRLCKTTEIFVRNNNVFL